MSWNNVDRERWIAYVLWGTPDLNHRALALFLAGKASRLTGCYNTTNFYMPFNNVHGFAMLYI